MQARTFGSGSYKYGFNGKENDRETVSTGDGTQDYGMRIYNPSLGKFLSVDPLFKTYPYKTPYDFAENSPIMGIDLDGGELEFFMYAQAGLYGATYQKIANDIEKGAVKSVKKFAHGIVQVGRLTGGQATNKEYVNAVVGITSQVLFVSAPGSNAVISHQLSKSKNSTLKAVGQNMKVLAKEEKDVVNAFKEGNTEKIAETVTDLGILAVTAVITEGITAYATPAEAIVLADELLGQAKFASYMEVAEFITTEEAAQSAVKVEAIQQQILEEGMSSINEPIYTTVLNGRTYILDGHNRLHAAFKGQYAGEIKVTELSPKWAKDMFKSKMEDIESGCFETQLKNDGPK